MPMQRKIYLVGSLKNTEIPIIGNLLRLDGHEVFDDWYSAGPEADDCWQAYEKERVGRTYLDALNGKHAKCVFKFDLENLQRADTTIMVMPCGKSGHIELGYQIGRGCESHIYMPQEPERYDVMYRFAHSIHTSVDQLRYAMLFGGNNIEK